MKNNIIRYVTLSLIFLALFPTRLAAQDIDQRTLEDPVALAKKCVSHGLRDEIDNHCGFAVNVLILRKKYDPEFRSWLSFGGQYRVEIPSGKEEKMNPPTTSEVRLELYACASPLVPFRELVKSYGESTDPEALILTTLEGEKISYTYKNVCK